MVVITGEYGQLANRLIVLANFIAAAREHGLQIAAPAFWSFAPLFESTRHESLVRYPADRAATPCVFPPHALQAAATSASRYLRKFERRFDALPGFRVIDIGWFGTCDLDSREFLDLARRPGLLFASGWQFRATRSFVRHAEAIRDCFRPPADVRRQARLAVNEMRKRADVVVGVHVRHGDYREFLGGRFFYALEIYARWMRALRDSLAPRRAAFMICSNAPQSLEALAGLNVAAGPGGVVEDLQALAECDYLLGPPSTFSRWALFMGRKPLEVMFDSQQTADLEQFSVTSHFDESRQPQWAALAQRPVA
ncbi:MAG: alpha-1,2-fucosyltransferase [Planctomycetes bacterium]|nr:alpha-1,2-fucosyltransferase [Planctomycetota bacterium]